MAKFVGVERPCEACGKLFRSPQSQKHLRACSQLCGQKIRVATDKKERINVVCAGCGKTFSERPCHAGRRLYCSRECQFTDPANLARMSANLIGEKNPAWKGGRTVASISAAGRRYARSPATTERAKTAMRRAARLQATPSWVNGDSVLAIYAEANRRSIESGVLHHVDHIVPLISKEVCGLHWEGNLQVLTATDNRKKNNKHWPDKP